MTLSGLIQDQKWSARSSPDNVIKGSRERGAGSRVRCEVLLPAPGSLLPSSTASPPVTGRTRVSLQNAMATAGAVANRTIGPAYVVASTATMRTSRGGMGGRSEEHTSELQSQSNLVCRLLLEKKKKAQ